MIDVSRRGMRRFAMMILFLLAACGPAPAPPTPTTPTPAPPTATFPRPTARPTPRPPITVLPTQEPPPPGALTLWAVASGSQLEALQRLIDQVSQEIGVEVVVMGKTPDGLHADIRANVLAGLPPPDLIWGTQEDLGLLYRAGLLQPAADGLDPGAFIATTVAGATFEGQRWGTPVAVQGYLLLLYNRKLVSDPPATTDELISRARALTSGGRYGLVMGWADPRWFVAWLTGVGGTLVGPDGAPTLDTPEMIAALNLLKELRPAGPPPPSTLDDGAALFEQGRVAFAIDGDWALSRYSQYTETLELGIAPLPIVPATGRVAAPPLNGVYLMYGARLAGASLEQARALGVALAQPVAQARVAGDLGLLPAARAAPDSPSIVQHPALAAAAAQLDGAMGLPATPVQRCAWEAIAVDLPEVLMGHATQEEAARRMQVRAANCVAART
jgi:ABC-type glycerol-3-phosphate transport system substrate-binding protein